MKRKPNKQQIKLWNRLVKEVFSHPKSQYSIFVYELIKRKGNILSADLWRLYLKKFKCKKIMPIAVRTYSEYCNKLVEIGIVQAKRAAIQGKVREFTVIR